MHQCRILRGDLFRDRASLLQHESSPFDNRLRGASSFLAPSLLLLLELGFENFFLVGIFCAAELLQPSRQGVDSMKNVHRKFFLFSDQLSHIVYGFPAGRRVVNG